MAEPSKDIGCASPNGGVGVAVGQRSKPPHEAGLVLDGLTDCVRAVAEAVTGLVIGAIPGSREDSQTGEVAPPEELLRCLLRDGRIVRIEQESIEHIVDLWIAR